VKACENSVNATATTITVTCSTAAGNALVAIVGQSDDQTATAAVSNSSAQAFTEISCGIATSGALNFEGRMFYLPNSAASTSVTATWSGSRINRTIILFELSGMATSSMLDSCINIGSAGAVTSLTSGSLTTTNANDVLIYGMVTNSAGLAPTAGSTYTIPTNGSTSTLGGRSFQQYKVVAATQAGVTTSMSFTGGPASAVGLFAGFKGAGSSTTVTGNLANAQNAGDFLVCYGAWSDNTSTVSSLTDTKGNTYTQMANSPKTVAGLSLVMYHADNIVAATPGANTTTLVLNASPTTIKLNCVEYAGGPAAPVDASAGATGTGTAIASGNVTTTVANDLLIGGTAVAGTITATSSGYTSRISTSIGDVEDRPVTSAAAYPFSPTQGTAVNWAAIVGAFKTSGVPSTFTVNLSGAGNGNGTITGGGFNCTATAGVLSGTCSVSVAAGSTLSLSSTPAGGSAFISYVGGGCASSPNCLTSAITTNTLITATFNLSGTLNYYVNVGTGNDANSGLCAVAGTPVGCNGPWKTSGHAISSFTLGASGTTIHVAAGTYPSNWNVTRGGASLTQRLVIQCDPGAASAFAAINQCKVTGTTVGFQVQANFVDIKGFDIGGNANMAAAVVGVCNPSGSTVPCPNSNSLHILGNYGHDLAQNVFNSAGTVGPGCPENGAFTWGSHGHTVTDPQAIGNILFRFGAQAMQTNSNCNVSQGIYGAGTAAGSYAIIQNNLIAGVPVAGIIDMACNHVISNNTVVNTRYGIIVSFIDVGTCGAQTGVIDGLAGHNSVINNAIFASSGGQSVFNVGNVADCTASSRTLYASNQSNAASADFTPARTSCDTVTPSNPWAHQSTANYFVNYQADGTGDYHLKTNSIGIDSGSINVCVSGGIFPCWPATDITGAPRGTMDVGAFGFP